MTNLKRVVFRDTKKIECETTPADSGRHLVYLYEDKFTPMIQIYADKQSLCQETIVTCIAVTWSTLGHPFVYQWYIKHADSIPETVGTNSSIYRTSTLINLDSIYCTIDVDTYGIATSNILEFRVATKMTPTITITHNPSGTVCQGTSVTYETTFTYSGRVPTFQWFYWDGVTGS